MQQITSREWFIQKKVSKRQYKEVRVPQKTLVFNKGMYTIRQVLFQPLESKQASLATHSLFCGWHHNHGGLSIETRVKNLPAELTSFLAKGTCMAKDMCHKVTSRLYMFSLHLVLYAATTATTRPIHSLKASLFLPKSKRNMGHHLLRC